MNIDVKNAFDNVIALCGYTRNTIDINTFLADIDNYISYVSTGYAAERFDAFIKIYAGKIDSDYNFVGKGERKLPEILLQCRKMDCAISNKTKIRSDFIVASFFTVLSQYYMEKGADRKHIDMQRTMAYLTDIKTFINDFSKTQDDNVATEPKLSSIDIKTSSKGKHDAEEAANLPEHSGEGIGESEPSLEELLEQLDTLIGLKGVKEEVKDIINLIEVNKKGSEFGIIQKPMSLHLVFYGNPGTGKTTVARILAKIYKALGVLSKGQLVEADRSRLVGGYVGQTAIKTQEVIGSAMGGILFIDEAYTLTHDKGGNDFGQEAVDTILKAMEDHRDDFIVIVAGYPELMKEFVESNPGLKSRFNQYINFEDYKPDELFEIFKLNCKDQELTIDEDCKTFLNEYFTSIYNNRTSDYANGRDVRNFFEKAIKHRANRINPILNSISKEDFCRFDVEDLKKAADQMVAL